MRLSMLRGLGAFGLTEAEATNCRQIIEMSPSSPEAAACKAMLTSYVAAPRTMLDRTLIQAATTGVQDAVLQTGTVARLQRLPVDTAWSAPVATSVPPPTIASPRAPPPAPATTTVAIAPPPVKVVDTSTSAPPPSSKTTTPNAPAVEDKPPSIEPEKKTEIKPPPVIMVDSDTGSQINRGGGGGSIYPSDAEATGEEVEATGQGQVIATASSGFWTFSNLKWPLGLILGAAVLFIVLPKIRRKKAGSLSGYGRRRFRAIPEDALE